MAGIGFVLQKVLKEGGFLSFVKVALAGTIIVAGPWLLSIIGIFVINSLAYSAIAESPNLFMAVIIYSYAFSLFLFGGFHYVFTRRVADLIYDDLKREAGSSLVLFSFIISFCAIIIAAIVFFNIDLRVVSSPVIFKIAAILLFVIINLIWLLMIFISLLKKYILIFLVYMLGMAGSFAGVVLLGKIYATGGAMLGFTLGQLIIVVFLYILAFLEYKPGKFDLKNFFIYFKKFRYLLFSGIFYYWGMWIDKLVFWFARGTRVENTFFKVFDLYDIPVYLSNLTIIPGLVFFMIVSETNFYNSLMDFLHSIHSSIYKYIQEKKYILISSMKKGLREQSFFQGVVTLVLILIAQDISKSLFGNSINLTIFRITLVAVFFHLLFLTLTIYLFYIQMFKKTFITTLCYFLINLGGSIIILISGNINLLGLSYLLAGLVASLVSCFFLIPALKRYDRILYIQAAKGE